MQPISAFAKATAECVEVETFEMNAGIAREKPECDVSGQERR
jgi:hypothetical protein